MLVATLIMCFTDQLVSGLDRKTSFVNGSLTGMKHIVPHFIRLTHPVVCHFFGYRLCPVSTPSRSGIAALPEWAGPVAFCLALGALVLFFSEEFVASVNRCGLCVSDACDVWAWTYRTFVRPVVGVIYFMVWCAILLYPSLVAQPTFLSLAFPIFVPSLLFPCVHLLWIRLSRQIPCVSLYYFCRSLVSCYLSSLVSLLPSACLSPSRKDTTPKQHRISSFCVRFFQLQ